MSKKAPATLTAFLVRLAIDPDAHTAFLADPDAAAAKAGLSVEERAVMQSGDQNRIYGLLAGASGSTAHGERE